ncbi:hypothetical protein AAFF_G00001270 [Aldrovandia affinis]|uniref:Uncharacterized protein n=1 Tax=Aldrovandia affinis TaxID=143900 RepID=A0AAD7TD86_9TELE|nr:hypothetical protein AAFF_G00001270 [Aldrovandia affinis]
MSNPSPLYLTIPLQRSALPLLSSHHPLRRWLHERAPADCESCLYVAGGDYTTWDDKHGRGLPPEWSAGAFVQPSSGLESSCGDRGPPRHTVGQAVTHIWARQHLQTHCCRVTQGPLNITTLSKD